MSGSSHASQKRPKESSPEVESLMGWATLVLQRDGQTPARHHRLLIAELDRVSRGDIDRLMVLMPPGSAKSTYTSLLFPAWWFT
jgi:hypothetical protein